MPTLWQVLCFIICLHLWPIIYANEYGLKIIIIKFNIIKVRIPLSFLTFK